MSPVPSAAATRLATSRPHAVLGASTAQGAAIRAHAAMAPAVSSSFATGMWVKAMSSSAPHDPTSAGAPGATTSATTGPPSCAAAPSSSRVMRARSGSTTTPTSRPVSWPGGGTEARSLAVGAIGVEGVALREEADRGADLIVEVGACVPAREPIRPHHAGLADRRGAPLGAPRARSEVAGGEGAEAMGRHRGAAGPIDLARIDEPLRGRHDRGQVHTDLRPPVVVLGTDVEAPVREREVPRTGHERQPEELCQLRADLAGVGVDRVATGEDQIERTRRCRSWRPAR